MVSACGRNVGIFKNPTTPHVYINYVSKLPLQSKGHVKINNTNNTHLMKLRERLWGNAPVT